LTSPVSIRKRSTRVNAVTPTASMATTRSAATGVIDLIVVVAVADRFQSSP